MKFIYSVCIALSIAGCTHDASNEKLAPEADHGSPFSGTKASLDSVYRGDTLIVYPSDTAMADAVSSMKPSVEVAAMVRRDSILVFPMSAEVAVRSDRQSAVKEVRSYQITYGPNNGRLKLTFDRRDTTIRTRSPADIAVYLAILKHKFVGFDTARRELIGSDILKPF